MIANITIITGGARHHLSWNKEDYNTLEEAIIDKCYEVTNLNDMAVIDVETFTVEQEVSYGPNLPDGERWEAVEGKLLENSLYLYKDQTDELIKIPC